MHPPLLVITGPTASGKSSLALKVARAMREEGRKSEIVCCDSMQIYRGLDIGTDKPPAEVRQEFPHHLIDLIEPDERFSVGDYCRAAHPAIAEIHARGALPIVVGGTGLYLRGLLYGLVDLEEGLQVQLDEKIAQLRASGDNSLVKDLERIDPESARRIHPNDHFRLTRALAFFQITGTPFSQFQKSHGFRQQRYRARVFALECSRQELYARIDRRLEEMLQRGLLEELQQALDRGISPTARALQGLAYRWFVKSLAGEISQSEALRLTQRDSRRYAKRQLTWFRPLSDIHWLSQTAATPGNVLTVTFDK